MSFNEKDYYHISARPGVRFNDGYEVYAEVVKKLVDNYIGYLSEDWMLDDLLQFLRELLNVIYWWIGWNDRLLSDYGDNYLCFNYLPYVMGNIVGYCEQVLRGICYIDHSTMRLMSALRLQCFSRCSGLEIEVDGRFFSKGYLYDRNCRGLLGITFVDRGFRYEEYDEVVGEFDISEFNRHLEKLEVRYLNVGVSKYGILSLVKSAGCSFMNKVEMQE